VDDRYVEAMMREALAEAKAAGEAGEYPIGAVVVIDGEVISRGRSRQRELRSQLAHCLGAAVMADVPHVVFAHPDPAVQSAQIIERVPYVTSHIETYRGGVLRDESRALFERYEPRMLAWLDDRVVRHRQTQAPD
jgi:tRNA(Arg) A34 adenosine deaminase TadA